MVLYCTVLQYILQMHTHPTVTHSRGRRILKIQDSSHKVCSDSENVNTVHFIRIQSVYTKSVGTVMNNNPQSRKWFGLFVCAHDLNWLLMETIRIYCRVGGFTGLHKNVPDLHTLNSMLPLWAPDSNANQILNFCVSSETNIEYYVFGLGLNPETFLQ